MYFVQSFYGKVFTCLIIKRSADSYTRPVPRNISENTWGQRIQENQSHLYHDIDWINFEKNGPKRRITFTLDHDHLCKYQTQQGTNKAPNKTHVCALQHNM